jgi:hypothetical protein
MPVLGDSLVLAFAVTAPALRGFLADQDTTPEPHFRRCATFGSHPIKMRDANVVTGAKRGDRESIGRLYFSAGDFRTSHR